jgi:DNA-binding beta-propeller fold protein YncE
VTLPENLM